MASDKILVLGIDTSCDDTAAAVLSFVPPSDFARPGLWENKQLSSVIISQNDYHAPFGGIVPELASRQHLLNISLAVGQALEKASVDIRDLDLVAATRGPGLVGSLLIGMGYGSSLAMGRGIPFIGVNHLAGHIHSARLLEQRPPTPHIMLIASGGHTSLVFVSQDYEKLITLSSTRDDAAGEAFDKAARLLGLSYPGGPAIDKAARSGQGGRIKLPRPMLGKGLDFSFSGLKTAIAHHIEKAGDLLGTKSAINDISFEFQQAVVQVLISKLLTAAKQKKVKSVGICGGVAANGALRLALVQEAEREGLKAYMPPISACTDNAAMIACAGQFYYYSALKNVGKKGTASLEKLGNPILLPKKQDLEIRPEWPVDEL